MSHGPWHFLSKSLFRGLEFADTWLGLPRKLGETLRFRKQWRRHFVSKTPATQPTLWIHGASVGELEDMAAFFLDDKALAQSGYSPDRVVITASSSSVQERLEAWKKRGFAYCGPLPPESDREAKSFLFLVKPECLVLSHADIWPVLFDQARLCLKKGCVWLPARVPSSKGLMNQSLGHFVRLIGCRSQTEVQFFSEHPLPGSPQIRWIGNPRVDRILSRIQEAKQKPQHVLAPWQGAPEKGKISVLVGSCWPEDARMLSSALSLLSPTERKRFQIVVIPHETRNPHLVASIKSHLPDARVISVQGVLAEAYRDFDVACVGGGFRTGLHNVLEPALWEVPIFTGPRLRQQPEAPQLIEWGQLRVVENYETWAGEWIRLLDPNELHTFRNGAKTAAQKLREHCGAADRLAGIIRENTT